MGFLKVEFKISFIVTFRLQSHFLGLCGGFAGANPSLGRVSVPQLQQRSISQQTSFEPPPPPPPPHSPAGRVTDIQIVGPPGSPGERSRAPLGLPPCLTLLCCFFFFFASKGERESPSSKRTAGPSHRRHVRTIQEVRTTVTRIITDVYYEDGKEVERKVSQVTSRFPLRSA